MKDTIFSFESKASFIHISNFGLFKPFFIACLWEYWNYFGQFQVPALAKIHPLPNYLKKKKQCSTIKLFSFFKYVLC